MRTKNPSPAAMPPENTEHLLSAKQVHSRPRIVVVVVEPRAECGLFFGRRGALQGKAHPHDT